MKRFIGALLALLLCLSVAVAQDSTPVDLPAEDGELSGQLLEHDSRMIMYIPFPVSITLDGTLGDRDGIPYETVTAGTMTSPDPAENGSFQFALASDAENIYLYMVMPDSTIVTGEHGENYWNEDSLEFYFNFTDDLSRTSYTDGVFQVNINPGNIGNTDPEAITLTGMNSSQSNVSAYVFPTADGWGFEAAIPIPESITVEHGAEIGFQAHANGSSGGDRDVKLIWSAFDSADTSYQNPSVFGTGMFYEVGNLDVPEVSARIETAENIETIEVSDMQEISVNQVGYLVNAPKYAMYANQGTVQTTWILKDDASGEAVKSGYTDVILNDSASGDTIQVADFSEFTTPGTYRIQINDALSSPFTIGDSIYEQLVIDAGRYFYLNRSGIELLPEFAGEDYARPAGHVTDNNVTCYKGTDAEGNSWDGCDYVLDAAGGWYDAGDYGKYVVNAGISVWTLLNLYERMPNVYPDESLNIPESGDGISDILSEARWEMEWMLSMQVPEGHPQAGMVHHKLHDLEWEGMPMMPPTEFDNNNEFTSGNGRYVYPPSTAATYNLAATAAQCARLWRDIDSDFADRCLDAAITAFAAGQSNPIALAGNTPGAGGGNYDDNDISDELFWAAAELYITTEDEQYVDAMNSTGHLARFAGQNANGAMSWGATGALGAFSLVLHDADLPQVDTLKAQIISTADNFLAIIDSEGYRVPISRYDWGSNSSVLNNAITLAYAYDLTGEDKYFYGMAESMDYILGRNPLAFSYVSGYGERSMQHPHHRVWANDPSNGYPAPPAGVVAGGPNAEPSDPTALEEAQLDAGPSRRYVDLIGSWSTNEVTINWNAPLVWVVAYIDQVSNP